MHTLADLARSEAFAEDLGPLGYSCAAVDVPMAGEATTPALGPGRRAWTLTTALAVVLAASALTLALPARLIGL
jgi:hypothetical protein